MYFPWKTKEGEAYFERRDHILLEEPRLVMLTGSHLESAEAETMSRQKTEPEGHP